MSDTVDVYLKDGSCLLNVELDGDLVILERAEYVVTREELSREDCMEIYGFDADQFFTKEKANATDESRDGAA